MSDNIRIRTTPNGTDKYLTLKVDQDFDFIEILSLKLSQDKAYERFCSDYGVIVGRVIINSGFGIPNAKVSVFIPISEEDKLDPKIKGLYPFETVNDVNSDGIRYNLLPKESDSQDECYTPVGSFSAKREFLDNYEMLEIYCKYYKFTTTTNHAGDFMIFGVPLGSHMVHVDVDISNIGIASQRPYDLIEQGTPSKMFYSPTKYKESRNLNSLIQIKSANFGVNVKPFWGDTDNCVIGINRLDFDLNYNIRPCAIFMGSLFGDSRKNSVNKNCRPRKKLGMMCEQVPREGTIEMLRKTTDGDIEKFDVEGGRVIDANGAWAYQIPMNLDYMVTDENGDLIPSDDKSRGLPTRARVRLRISMDEGGGVGRLRTRGKYIIPHNPKKVSDIDFSFDKSTKDNENTFRDLYWNKIYSVKNFISRVERSTSFVPKPYKIKTYTGIKDVDGCVGNKSPMPFNRTYVKGNVLFAILCAIYNLLANITYVFNSFLCALVNFKIPIIKVRPFGWAKRWFIKLKCPNEADSEYILGTCRDDVDSYMNCIKAVLADELDLFEFDFYNDWINGSLYYYLLKYKKTRRGREKFCETNCNGYTGGTGYNSCKDNQLRDTTFSTRSSSSTIGFNNGLLVKYDGNLYYPPMTLNGTAKKLFPTDLVNLGSVFECDWQGLPKIVDYLTSSSYKVPPLVAESYLEDNLTSSPNEKYVTLGMFNSNLENGAYYDGLFFNVKCLQGVDYDIDRAKNIRRQCELNVDIVEIEPSGPIPPYIGINQIYELADPNDVLYSINRYVRDSFYLLNVSGTSISQLPSVNYDLLNSNQGTSIGVNNINVNGQAYENFRGSNLISSQFKQSDNSYYMYFGIIPGKTALDKLKSKFFTDCTKVVSDDFIIDTSVINASLSGVSDGSITFTFIGGTAPYTYTWTGIDIDYFTDTKTTQSTGTISGLHAGTYQIIATDVLGTSMTKDIAVGGPTPLSCSFIINSTVSSETALDGSIQVSQIEGGHGPYSMQMIFPNGNVVNYPSPLTLNSGDIIDQLGLGDYTFIVTDSLGDTCTSTVSLTGPLPISVFNLDVINTCSDCNGIVTLDITGGTAPYTIELITGGTVINTGSMTSFGNLCVGDYLIRVTDSGDPTVQVGIANFTINNGLYISSFGSDGYKTLNFFPMGYTIHIQVNDGVPSSTVPAFTVLVSGNQATEIGRNPYRYEYTIPVDDFDGVIEVIDDNGCNKTFNI